MLPFFVPFPNIAILFNVFQLQRISFHIFGLPEQFCPFVFAKDKESIHIPKETLAA
jgi:hypothetical protein